MPRFDIAVRAVLWDGIIQGEAAQLHDHQFETVFIVELRQLANPIPVILVLLFIV